MQPTRGLAFRAAKSHHTELMINKNSPVFSHKTVKPFFPSSLFMRCYLEFKLTAVKSHFVALEPGFQNTQELLKVSITFAVSPSFVSSTDVKTLLSCTLAWLGLSETQSGGILSQWLGSQLGIRCCTISRRLDCGQTAELATDIFVKGTEMGVSEICSPGQIWIANQME